MNCKRCGKEMELTTLDGTDYYVCHDCKIKQKAFSQAAGYEEEYGDSVWQPAKKKLSVLLLISFIIGVLYLLYSAYYWSGALSAGGGTARQAGAGLATVLVTPHLVCTVLAVIFNALGLFMRKRGFALAGAVLYTVAIVLFPLYFMFVIAEMILSYIGFAKMKPAD